VADRQINPGLSFRLEEKQGSRHFPLDGKIVCREIGEDDAAEPTPQPRGRQDASRSGRRR
jgi:hypothetical protein